MRRRLPEMPVAELNLMPFLDLVFAFIGILVVIFALQKTLEQTSGRPLAIDALVICVADGEVTLYADPKAAPARYAEQQFPALLDQLSEQGEGVRNLVFALTGACFETRQAFQDAFARFTSLLQRNQDKRLVVRLAYRPLSGRPEAVSGLLADWRTADGADGD
ncbi:hypothetical protein G3480_12010 [Thiorhodococcus mannitoliphagus]|uniref:Uncharacterized protein n=1 Tax=Thiorhodococcus mannitoliphagus TaxID=329406 RepID=A0A6P1DRX5_9GAMM|nr:hypothetical protein [Thiorhodococcus mannitoliphagus]NEX21027.1 hypothetical protein [Thiorhodococcus mannitoliphagus]